MLSHLPSFLFDHYALAEVELVLPSYPLLVLLAGPFLGDWLAQLGEQCDLLVHVYGFGELVPEEPLAGFSVPAHSS